MPGRKPLFRIAITKVVETEGTLLGDLETPPKAVRVVRKEALELLCGLEVVLRICADRVPGLGKHFPPANTGQNVL